MHRHSIFLMAAGWALVPFTSVYAQQARQIDLPFKLTWGESSERIEKMIRGAAAKIVNRRLERGGIEAWEVEGIAIEALRKTLFRFQNDQLIGLELQYRGPIDTSGRETWSEERYADFMGRWRRNLDQQYGSGQLLTRKTGAEGDVSQTLSGYRWTLGNTTVDLISFTAERGPERFQTLSVHYRIF
jgi:hypothetical protein